jgi:hypothetical protein
MVCGTWCSEDENPCPRCASEVDHPIKCPNCDEVIEDPGMCELCYWELDTGETAPEEAPADDSAPQVVEVSFEDALTAELEGVHGDLGPTSSNKRGGGGRRRRDR